jgi:hypothetical protein
MSRINRRTTIKICMLVVSIVLLSSVVALASAGKPDRLKMVYDHDASTYVARTTKSSAVRARCIIRHTGKRRRAGKVCPAKKHKAVPSKPRAADKGVRPGQAVLPTISPVQEREGEEAEPGGEPEPVSPAESEPVLGEESKSILETEPTSETGGLSISVSGNHLINGSGQLVTLHGVNISGTEWQCLYHKAFYGPHGEASIEAIAAWHINAVRIPLNEDCWLGINGAPTDIEIYHEEIRNYVEQLHAHGLYTILDLHWIAPGNKLSQRGSSPEGSFEMADESHSLAFWASTASYFISDHAVLFDLFNDPHNISWACWLNGCVAPRGYLTAGMQQLVNTVRGVGATQPVMAGALEATQLGHAWLENRPRDPAGQLVAAVHVYNQRSTTHFSANIGTVATQVPVIAGEIGEMDCADEDIDSFLPWADSQGVSYLAWAWFVGGCASYPALISDYDGTPTNFGIGYREHLLAAFPAP